MNGKHGTLFVLVSDGYSVNDTKAIQEIFEKAYPHVNIALVQGVQAIVYEPRLNVEGETP